MEEKKEQDSGRGMVPIPLSNVRILQPKPAAQGEQLKWLRKEGRRGGEHQEENSRMTMVEVELQQCLGICKLCLLGSHSRLSLVSDGSKQRRGKLIILSLFVWALFFFSFKQNGATDGYCLSSFVSVTLLIPFSREPT